MINLVLLSTIGTCLTAVAGQTEQDCAKETKCVPIEQCKTYLPLARKPSKTPEDYETMRKAFCGFQDGTPKVCCPDKPCRVEGMEGACVALSSCPHVARLLIAPAPPENILRVQALRCNGFGRYSVCCTDEPPTVLVANTTTPATAGYHTRPDAVGGSPTRYTPSCPATAAPPEPRSGCCGRDVSSEDRISNGNETSVDQYPWLALIEYRDLSDGLTKLMCGGALVSATYVLTAGHCVAGLITTLAVPIAVRLGEYDTSHEGADCVSTAGGGRDCTTPVVIPVEASVAHPEYRPYSPARRHDIALLRLKGTAPYTDMIRPICLPAADVTSAPPPALVFWVAGWGAVDARRASSSVKLHVDVPYSAPEQCQKYYVGRMRYQLQQEQICAGGRDHKDSCQGDSGGPLMYTNDTMDYYEVSGIVSFGPSPCGEFNIPGVYTKVFSYNAWIRSVMVP